MATSNHKLLATMTEEQKELFTKYADCIREYQVMAECLLYQNSFRLGGRMMQEVMRSATATMDHHCNTPGHPRHPSAEFKYEVLRRCFELGEDVEYVSREIGYSRMSIYAWRRKYLKYGMVGLMAKRKSIPRAPMPQDHALPESEELEKLRTQLQELQFEVDVMKETIAVLKKDPGVDLAVLRNREKAVIIDALKGKYALPTLLSRFNMAKSSYYYQRAVMNKPDKYLSYRAQITAIFQENRGVYGYRRIYLALKREGVILSEKIIRRIMKEELTVLLSKKRKYSSYLGEITPECVCQTKM